MAKTAWAFTVNGMRANKRLLQVMPVILGLCAWEILVKATHNELIPSPSQAIKAIVDLAVSHVLFEDCFVSLKRVLSGFALAAFAGVFFGFCLGLSPWFRSAFSPLIELLRPIPPIAWIPIAIAIFGIGDASACFVIFIGAFYPVLTNTFLGVSEVSTNYLEAAKVLGASPWRVYREVIFPAALPSIFAGLRVGLGFAWMCVVAAEMIAARSGLGYEIQLNRQLLQLDRVVAGMAMIGLIGVLMNRAMGLLEDRLIPWRELRQEASSPQPEDDAVASPSSSNTFPSPLKPLLGASLKVEDVSFSYPSGAEIIRDLNLSIKAGEAFCILGKSGCGKTTLLRLLAGLRVPSRGRITIDEVPLEAHKDEVTLVFQNAALFPWLTAAENVAFALRSRGLAKHEAVNGALEHLQLVGVKNRANNYPNQLSGGQQQRVALARALAYKPRLILMDEPFSALDSQTRESLQQDVLRLLRQLGITLILVTHDIREAIFMSDRIGILSPKRKTIVKEFQVDYEQPREDEFRYHADFGKLRSKIWECFQSEAEPIEVKSESDAARYAKL